MFTLLAKMVLIPFYAIFVICVLFLTLCLNTFTLPWFLLCYLFCSLFHMKGPTFTIWGLMLYPTWKQPGISLKVQIINFFKSIITLLLFLITLYLFSEGLWVWGIFAAIATLIAFASIAPQSKNDKNFSQSNRQQSGIEFEKSCAKRLSTLGFHGISTTPASGDYGADIIAYDNSGNKWVFQCKYYRGKISNSAVQEVVAAKAHYSASKAAVMTNSQLTEKARQLAVENDVLLYELL